MKFNKKCERNLLKSSFKVELNESTKSVRSIRLVNEYNVVAIWLCCCYTKVDFSVKYVNICAKTSHFTETCC